jgi:hypothetical protein
MPRDRGVETISNRVSFVATIRAIAKALNVDIDDLV